LWTARFDLLGRAVVTGPYVLAWRHGSRSDRASSACPCRQARLQGIPPGRPGGKIHRRSLREGQGPHLGFVRRDLGRGHWQGFIGKGSGRMCLGGVACYRFGCCGWPVYCVMARGGHTGEFCGFGGVDVAGLPWVVHQQLGGPIVFGWDGRPVASAPRCARSLVGDASWPGVVAALSTTVGTVCACSGVAWLWRLARCCAAAAARSCVDFVRS